MTEAFGMRAIAEISATRIVDCLVAGTLIAVVAGLMTQFSRRQNSAARFAVWFSALMAIALSPLFSGARRSYGAILAIARPATLTVPSSWAFYLFGLWAVIAGCLLLRIGVGLWRLRSLRKTLVRLDVTQLDPAVRETLTRHKGSREVSLCTSEQVRVPAAIGLIEPMVVVPLWVVNELSSEELKQVLLHELAHLRRRDDWTNLVQQIVKAVFFFHPAVWWIEKKISLEREMACDDAVLAETEKPKAYAECLRHIAEKSVVRRSLALAQAALGRVRQTSMRVAQILDANRPKSVRTGWKSTVMLAGFVIVSGMLVSRETQLVAFQDAHPVAASPTPRASRSMLLSPMLHNVAFNTHGQSSALPKAVPLVLHVNKPLNVQPTGMAATNLKNAHLRERAPEPTSVRFASSKIAPVMPTEAVFVIVEHSSSNASAQAVYEIQVWRFVIRPQAVSGASQLPRKEI